MIDQERVRTTFWMQIMAAASLAHLQQDLGKDTPFPVRVGRYRIHQDRNGIRIENVNSPNFLENQVARVLKAATKRKVRA